MGSFTNSNSERSGDESGHRSASAAGRRGGGAINFVERRRSPAIRSAEGGAPPSVASVIDSDGTASTLSAAALDLTTVKRHLRRIQGVLNAVLKTQELQGARQC